MVAVPLALNSNKRSGLPEARCYNMFVEKDGSGISPDGALRIQRPGLNLSQTLPAPIRGILLRAGSGQRLSVSGGNLYADAANVGQITGAGIAPMTETNFYAAIVGATTLYLYDTSLITVAMPDGRLVQDVDQLNSYILVLCPDGVFYWIVPGDSTVDPLNFATAESSPDGGTALVRVGDEFLILGTASGEWWQPTGDLDAPFQRVSGRPVEKGCNHRDTALRFDNSVVWVGENNVYRWTGTASIISDSGLSERIRLATGPLSAFTMACDGHDFYVLRIPGQGTWVFDAATSAWSEWGTGLLGFWEPQVAYQFGGDVFAGSSENGRIFQITAASINDVGTPFLRLVTGSVPLSGAPPRVSSFCVGANLSADAVVRLRWRDGQEDYPAYYDEYDVRSQFDIANWYRLGAPDQPYREFEVSVTADVRAVIYGAKANEAWG